MGAWYPILQDRSSVLKMSIAGSSETYPGDGDYRLLRNVGDYRLHGFAFQKALTLTYYRVYVRFEVSTAVTMMIIIFWEMTPCGSYKNRRFGGSYRLHL
jgi:hypothetical protein